MTHEKQMHCINHVRKSIRSLKQDVSTYLRLQNGWKLSGARRPQYMGVGCICLGIHASVQSLEMLFLLHPIEWQEGGREEWEEPLLSPSFSLLHQPMRWGLGAKCSPHWPVEKRQRRKCRCEIHAGVSFSFFFMLASEGLLAPNNLQGEEEEGKVKVLWTCMGTLLSLVPQDPVQPGTISVCILCNLNMFCRWWWW